VGAAVWRGYCVRHAFSFQLSALNSRRGSGLTADGFRLTYDATGSHATRTDGNGFTTIYRYDNNRRLTEIEYPDGKKVQYAFDEKGNKTFEGHIDPGQNFAATTRTFTYDELNRLRSVTDTSLGKTIQYEFDENGNRSIVIDAEGGITKWEYDRNNRPVKVTDADGQVTRFEYDAAGRRTKVIYGNGVWTEYRYDASSQLTHMITRDRTNLTLQGWYYQYDLRGNRTSKTDHAGNVEAYFYDALGRLVQTTYSDGRVVKWTFDAVGNRLAQDDNGSVTTYTYNSANQIQTLTSPTGAVTTFGFDGNGNMTHKNEPSGTTYFAWDFENRLRQVNSTGGVTDFGYNAGGIRVFKESGGVRTDYLIDTVSVLAEYENGVKKSAYVLGSRIDEILNSKSEIGKYWYLADALGSVTALTDAAGRIIKTYRYGAWGEDFGVTGPEVRNPYRWTGREWDPTGLQYNRARYYASALGRWMNKDPFGMQDGPNAYVYVRDNPTTNNDPLGLLSCTYSVMRQTLTCIHLNPDEAWNMGVIKMCPDSPSGDNDLTNECKDSVGPVPRGTYSIGPFDTETPSGRTLDNFLLTRIGPDPCNGSRSGGFLIHKGQRTEGCILVSRSCFDWIKEKRSQCTNARLNVVQ